VTLYLDARETLAKQSWGAQGRGHGASWTPGFALRAASWGEAPPQTLARPPNLPVLKTLPIKWDNKRVLSIIACTALGELSVTAAVPPSSR